VLETQRRNKHSWETRQHLCVWRVPRVPCQATAAREKAQLVRLFVKQGGRSGHGRGTAGGSGGKRVATRRSNMRVLWL
jgi:hypothetical protein